MKIHRTNFYRDGHRKVEYCEVCSAEGEQLLDGCPSPSEQKRFQAMIVKNDIDKARIKN